MIEHYFNSSFITGRTLQAQIREKLVENIMSGHIPRDKALPSSRKLAKRLQVSRNTILCIYDSLIDDGFLVSKNRSGYYVSPEFNEEDFIPQLIKRDNKDPQCSSSIITRKPQKNDDDISSEHPIALNKVSWANKLKRPNKQPNIIKPSDWASYQYPFIYGQVQQDSFPIEHWRNSVRSVLNYSSLGEWMHDLVDQDDASLIEQIRTRILPRRGVYVQPNEILITMGTQNSLFLIGKMFCDENTNVAIEDPGFRDAYNIFKSFNANISLHDVDSEGLVVDEKLKSCDYIFTTPGHQVPTGAILSLARRTQLLNLASKNDFVILEDDYDCDTCLDENASPALKASDVEGRVIYMGSLSKSVTPGVRMGFIVADKELISELRSLRRLIYRHPPTNNQRTVAHFISQGFYDTHLKKTRELNRQKKELMSAALDKYLPNMLLPHANFAQSAFWLKAQIDINTEHLAQKAAKKSILIEPGFIHFFREQEPQNYFRLGFSAIQPNFINSGIQKLKEVIDKINS